MALRSSDLQSDSDLDSIPVFEPLGPQVCLRGRIFQYTPPLGSVLLQSWYTTALFSPVKSTPKSA